MAEKVNWAAVNKAEADAKTKAAEAKGKEADAKAAAEKAKSDQIAAETKLKIAELEAKTAKEKADAAERAALRTAEAKKDGDSLLGTVAHLAKQYAPAVAMGVAFGLGGKAIAARSSKAAATAVAQVEKLGAEAAKIAKTKGTIVGTPAGDQMQAIVTEATRRGAPNFANIGKTPKAADVAAVALTVEGGVTTAVGMGVDKAVGVDLGLSEESRATMRTVGLGSLGGAMALKTTLALGKAGAPMPSAKATAAIEAGAERLARETAAGAGKAGKARIAKTVAQAEGELASLKSAGKVQAAIAAVNGKTAVAVAGTQGKTATKIVAAKGDAKLAKLDVNAAIAAVTGKSSVALAGTRGRVAKSVVAAKGTAKISSLSVDAAIVAMKGQNAVAATGARGKVTKAMIAAKGESKVAAAKGSLRGPAGASVEPAARGLSGLLQGAQPLPPVARRHAAAPRTRSTGDTYTRTYKSGPKAGMTETVTKRR